MPDLHAPRLGEPGEPCRGCGATLADDQRYCLECGTRRGEPRLAFRDLGAGAVAAPAPLVATRPAATGLRSNPAILASIGCLLLAMGVGVLIGRSGDRTVTPPQAAAAPQVIRVTGGAATTADTASTADASSPAKAKKTKRKKAGKAAKQDSVPTAASAGASKATNPALKNLDKLSPKDYQKKAAKLPKTVGTGGKAPPKDDKAPAAGGSFETIG